MTAVEISISRLVPKELERSLLATQQSFPWLFEPSGKSAHPLHINLKEVTWVDIGATAQLVVLIDGWAQKLGSISVSLPGSSSGNANSTDSDRHQRLLSARFLRYLRFFQALKDVSTRRSVLVEFFSDGDAILDTAEDEDFPETYKRIVPLQWIKLSDTEKRKQLAQHLADAVRNSGEGVDGPDAKALSNIVLYELIENVTEHSQAGDAALICGFAHTESIRSKREDLNSEELPYLLAADDTGQPILEVIVGDSGRGIVQTLENSYQRGPGTQKGNLTKRGYALPHNVVRWAFDRWSTEKTTGARKRGVRGLYRIDRLVAKYFGQISVRTDRTLFVREHIVNASPVERFNKEPKKYAPVNGTVVRIRMTGIAVPGITEVMSRYRTEARTLPTVSLVGNIPPEKLFVERLFENGFDTATEEEIITLLGHDQVRPTSLYILLASLENANRSLELAMRFLCAHASPVPIYALNVRCSLDELYAIASSINAECDGVENTIDGSASLAEQLDVILVTHASGVRRWIGLPTELATLVQDVALGDTVSIPHDLYATVLKSEARLKTFFVVEEGGDVHPFKQLRCIGDTSPFRNQVLNDFREKISKSDSRPHSSIWHEGPYLTPTLSFVERWMRIDQLLSSLDVVTFQALAFELACALETSFNATPLRQSGMLQGLFLTAEDRSSELMRDALEERFGFRRFQTPTNSQALLASEANRKIPVIVYADLISSGESLRRAAQTVLRQGLSVAAVVALLDTRTSTSSYIEAFGHRIPLIVLIHEPSEIHAPKKFSVVAPSLLHAEIRGIKAQDVLQKVGTERKTTQYIWNSLEFKHQVRTSGRHLTLTINPEHMLAQKSFPKALTEVIETSALFPASDTNESFLVLSPAEERDDKWRTSVRMIFERTTLKNHTEVEFVTRMTVGKTHTFAEVSSLAIKIRRAALVVIFDWGAISGKTIDALTTSAVDAGARRILVIVANSQLNRVETQFRSSVATLQIATEEIGADLLSTPVQKIRKIEYRYAALSNLALGQFSEADCPVCSQVIDLLSIPCTDSFISAYRESALKRLHSPSDLIAESNETIAVTQEIAAWRLQFVAAQTETAQRLALKLQLDELVADSQKDSLSVACFALIELLHLEGHWIQLPPIRYRACRDPIAEICLKVIWCGDADARAKAISVLRRVSKTLFIKNASNIFDCIAGQNRPIGALLLGLHTYITRRYHESVTMLEPVIAALERLDAKVLDDSSQLVPIYSEAIEPVQYLLFQAKFLSSRAYSKDMDHVDALHKLRFLLSEPNYHAHGVHNKAIERLLDIHFLSSVRDHLRKITTRQAASHLSSEISDLLPGRLLAWVDIHKFLTTRIIPLASAARKEFESRQFREHLGIDEAQWFLGLLDSHANGLAPELSPGQFLQKLSISSENKSLDTQANVLLDLLDASTLELNRLLNIIFRAEQKAQPSYPNRPAVSPSLLKEFLDELSSNAHQALVDAAKELQNTYEKTVQITLELGTAAQDYVACCPRSLLREITLELLTNVGRYSAVGSCNTFDAYITCTLKANEICVQFTNALQKNARMLVDPQRHGIELSRKDLVSFGGSLEVVESEIQFTAHLTLRRWRPK